MALREFTRYVGYDNADSFRGFLIQQFAASQKGGLFFKEKLPMATTTEISAASAYTAASFDKADDIKKAL